MRPGIWQILLIVLIVLVVFGAGKLPQVMKSLGEGIRGFKKALKEDDPKPPAAPPPAPGKSDSPGPADNDRSTH